MSPWYKNTGSRPFGKIDFSDAWLNDHYNAHRERARVKGVRVLFGLITLLCGLAISLVGILAAFH